MMNFPLFTQEDGHRASNEWGANCGPGAIAAIMHMTLDDLRPYMDDFEKKHYTNPTLMWRVLKNLNAKFSVRKVNEWPVYGLARIQWEGPWTDPGVPVRVRYRHTHWVGVAERGIWIFDINAMAINGWLAYRVWTDQLVPWLLKECVPRANGFWHITHSVEIDPSSIRGKND